MNLRCLVLPLALVLGASLGVVACSSADDAGSTRLREGKNKAKGADGADEETPGTGPASTPGPGQAPSKGCNTGAPKAASSGLATNLTMTVRGNERTYDLTIPTTYDPTRPYPVVFVFHGSGGTGANVRGTFSFENIAGDAAVFVYPNGKDNQWDLDSPADENGDVAFFDQLVSNLEANLCVDASRVFATGYSNGAFFANQLGCHRGAKLRALASHGGGGPYGSDDRYDDEGHLVCNGKPPAVMFVHGEDDGVVSISDAQSGLAHWRWASSCDDGSSPRAPAPCVAFNGCSNAVVWCPLPGVGHELWGAGARATWDFFKGF
jgi:polyhydroxybutyrate depolymerase